VVQKESRRWGGRRGTRARPPAARPATRTPRPTTASPTPSRTTASPTPSNTGGAKGCSATYAVQSDWGAGFVASVTVQNTGASTTSGWRVTWSFGGNQQITSSWSATVNQSGAAVTATSASWNGSLGAGATAQFGFQGTYSGGNAVPTVTCVAS
jgi:cellulose 1,4-beta-cellobiosidase